MNWCSNEETCQWVQGICNALSDSTVQFGLSIVVLIFLLWLLLRKRQPTRIIAYHSENGRVMVSRSAILELVQSACNEIEQIYRPSVRIRTVRGTCHLKVGIKLASGGKLRDLEEKLQQHLRQSLTDTLGIEKLGTIDVTATGFKNKKGPKAVDLINEDNDLSDLR
jgi:hypothetical protein